MDFQNMKRKENASFSFPVHFEGGLQSCVRAELIYELLLYILFERQQIPFSFKQIKHEVSQKVTQGNVKGMPLISRLETKKAFDLVNKLDETKLKVCQAFDVCPEIQKVVVAIGATALSPKEVFIIQLPPLNPEADNLSGKTCVKTMFRQLIMQDPLGEIKQISPTNVSLLLYAPRKSQLSWFYPKPTYKLPIRGRQFEFSLQSKCGQGSHDLSTNFSIVELSGFEPFDSFIDEGDEVSHISTVETTSHSSEGSVTADYVCIDSDHDVEIVNPNDVKDLSANVTVCASNSESDTKGSSKDMTPVVDTDHSGFCSGDNKKMQKSSSASSILSQTSLMSGSSQTNLRSDNLKKCSVSSLGEGSTDGFSISDSEYIWFQSPLLIKGYRSK